MLHVRVGLADNTSTQSKFNYKTYPYRIVKFSYLFILANVNSVSINKDAAPLSYPAHQSQYSFSTPLGLSDASP